MSPTKPLRRMLNDLLRDVSSAYDLAAELSTKLECLEEDLDRFDVAWADANEPPTPPTINPPDDPPHTCTCARCQYEGSR